MSFLTFRTTGGLVECSFAPSGQRIRIVIPDSPLNREHRDILMDVIRGAGHEPSSHVEMDRELFDADLVILIGNSLRQKALISLLRERRDDRPTVIIWQTEPLPPPGITPLAEATGRRVVGLNWSRLPTPLRRMLEFVVPFRMQALDGVRWLSAGSYRRELARDPAHHGWGEFSIRRFRQVMNNFLHLRDALDEGLVDHVVVSTRSRFELLTNLGIPASFCPIGYHEIWGRDLGTKRDIDVLFLGTLKRNKSHRAPVLRRITAQLAAANRKLHIVSEGCHGADRERLLNRSRIVLNLPRIPWDFPIMRLLMCMGCGALVVSEEAADPDPFVPGEHFVSAPTNRLVDRILYYLEHEAQRENIAAQGRRFVTEELAMTRLIPNLLFPDRAPMERNPA